MVTFVVRRPSRPDATRTDEDAAVVDGVVDADARGFGAWAEKPSPPAQNTRKTKEIFKNSAIRIVKLFLSCCVL